MKQRDINRKDLVKAIIKQNGGRIFTVVAKRKSPKKYFIVGKLLGGTTSASWGGIEVKEGDKYYLNTKKNQRLLEAIKDAEVCEISEHTEHFMEMTCRTGVKKDLKGGQSTISVYDDLISVNLTNGKGYRCFSAFNVLEIRAGGAILKFSEDHVLSFEG